MANPTLYSLRRFYMKAAEDSAYSANPKFVTREREITGSDTAAFTLTLALTSSQSALTINFNDVKACRRFYLDTDSSVKLVFNSSASVIVGLTSASATVGRPMVYLEGSITAATVANRIAAPTKVHIFGSGTTV